VAFNLKEFFDKHPDIAAGWDTEWTPDEKVKFLSRHYPKAKHLGADVWNKKIQEIDSARNVALKQTANAAYGAVTPQGNTLAEKLASLTNEANPMGNATRGVMVGGQAAANTQPKDPNVIKAMLQKIAAGIKRGGQAAQPGFQPKPEEQAMSTASTLAPAAGFAGAGLAASLGAAAPVSAVGEMLGDAAIPGAGSVPIVNAYKTLTAGNPQEIGAAIEKLQADSGIKQLSTKVPKDAGKFIDEVREDIDSGDFKNWGGQKLLDTKNSLQHLIDNEDPRNSALASKAWGKISKYMDEDEEGLQKLREAYSFAMKKAELLEKLKNAAKPLVKGAITDSGLVAGGAAGYKAVEALTK